MLRSSTTIKGLYSKLTGISLVGMALITGFSYGFVFNTVYVKGNGALTMLNIQSNGGLYALGNLGWCVIGLLDLVVAYGIYQIYKHKVPKLAAMAAGLRVFYSAFFFYAIIALYQSHIDLFMQRWSLALIIFGLHLMGIFIANAPKESLVVPRVIGLLLLVAGMAYSVIFGIRYFLPLYEAVANTIEGIMVIPMALSELVLALYLVIKGEL